MTTKTAGGADIRWLIRRDLPDVLAIEDASFERPWTEEDFLECLQKQSCIGLVAERHITVVGFAICELHKKKIELLNLAVDPSVRRQGVGTQMVLRLVGKLSQQRREQLLLDVRETNLAAQKFFQSQGFRAVSVLKNHYGEEDAYRMCYRLPSWWFLWPAESDFRVLVRSKHADI